MRTPADHSDEKLLAELRASHGTKSAQIRTLAEAGWPRAKIAEALSIRYQHVRNVLVADEKKAKAPVPARGRTPPALVAPAPVNGPACDYQCIHDALVEARYANKTPVNLSINLRLLAAAKQLGINLSETLERELTAILLQQARERWQAENSEAIEAHNQFVERHGLWSDGLRQF